MMLPLHPREVVRHFLDEVRSGRHPERAARWMADQVYAYQVQSEASTELICHCRTPQDYAEHVSEMWAMHGPFTFEVEELLCDGNKVYARWRQCGWQDQSGEARRPLIELASAVYQVEDGKIVAYHIQIDRQGLAIQQAR